MHPHAVKLNHIANEYTSALKDFFTSPRMYSLYHDMHVQVPTWNVAKRSRVTGDTKYELPDCKDAIAGIRYDPRTRLNSDMFRTCDI